MKALKRVHRESCGRKLKLSKKEAGARALALGLEGIEYTYYRCAHCKAHHLSHRHSHTQHALFGGIPWGNEIIPKVRRSDGVQIRRPGESEAQRTGDQI